MNNIARNIIAAGCMLAFMGCGGASAADALEINYQGDKASPRITYATEQVKAACAEVSASRGLADRLKPGLRARGPGLGESGGYRGFVVPPSGGGVDAASRPWAVAPSRGIARAYADHMIAEDV